MIVFVSPAFGSCTCSAIRDELQIWLLETGNQVEYDCTCDETDDCASSYVIGGKWIGSNVVEIWSLRKPLLGLLLVVVTVAPEAVWQVGRPPYQSESWYGGAIPIRDAGISLVLIPKNSLLHYFFHSTSLPITFTN